MWDKAANNAASTALPGQNHLFFSIVMQDYRTKIMTTPAASKEVPLGDATDVARKTLRLLASKRVAPTPDNYRQFYLELAGIAPVTSAEPEQQSWGLLIAALVKHWEARQVGWTTARKREGLQRVLATSDPALLFKRVAALIQSWSKSASSDALGVPTAAGSASAAMPADPAHHETSVLPLTEVTMSHGSGEQAELAAALREWLANALESMVAVRLSGNEKLAAEARRLAASLRALHSQEALPTLSRELRTFWRRVDKQCADDTGLRDGVLRLLRLMVENIHELLADDRWLQGQMDMVRRVLSEPNDIQLIEDAERSIKAVIFKQGILKNSLNEAKSTLKDMVSRFIDQLGEVSESTGAYHSKLDHYAQTIRETEDIGELSTLLDDLMHETQQIQTETARSREGIIAVRARAETAEQKVRQLEAELVQASELVREDQLTGVLNRRGLDDAFQREMSRVERSKNSFCVALLDLDNFKRLNDSHGHQAGDRALVHMTEIVKSTVRPHDIVARYGGEEFLILLPDTEIDEAIAVITRLQRNLTTHFFLHNNEKLLITFSAGVALLAAGETRESLVERADIALYQAKAAGKNRVIAALEPPAEPQTQELAHGTSR